MDRSVRRRVLPCLLAALGLLPHLAGPPARAQGVLAPLLGAHAECAVAGRESGVCSGILTTHCLETARNMSDLTACRAAVATALEAEAAELSAALAARGARARASEIAAGADRVVTEFCAALGARTAEPGSAAHDIRCAMMRAHVTVYHLFRALAETEDAA